MAHDGVLQNIQFNDKVTCVLPAKSAKNLKLLIILYWQAQLNCIRSKENPEFLLFKETNLCVNFKMSQAKFLVRETNLCFKLKRSFNNKNVIDVTLCFILKLCVENL